MRVNGKDIELKRGMTLAEFLAEHNYRAELVAGSATGRLCRVRNLAQLF